MHKQVFFNLFFKIAGSCVFLAPVGKTCQYLRGRIQLRSPLINVRILHVLLGFAWDGAQHSEIDETVLYETRTLLFSPK
jgi:hypothetical protein